MHKKQTEALSQAHGIPIVASSRVLMHTPKRKMLLDCLTAIRHSRSVRDSKSLLRPNAENHLRPIARLLSLYGQTYVANSLDILNRCTFELSQIAYRYPRETVPPGLSASLYLRELTYSGACKRYKCQSVEDLPAKVTQLLEKELRIIGELHYEYYFLTIFDIVAHARAQGILCQGRGSAANSAVCYCLGITAVDPMRSSLLFERFISKRRNEPPDIDVDFENARREEVIQYIYQKYGRDRCALAATVITYRPRSALRDLGKALGVDLAQLENVIANYGWRYRGPDWIDEVIDEKVSRDSHLLSCFKQLLKQLLGFPRHLSQHVGGFIITEGKLTEQVPIENAAMPDRTVIQWDKQDLEALGLMKVDILALGMLSAIQKTLGQISVRLERPFDLTDIPAEEDPAVYAMLQKADSVGLFQVESRAQMNMLPRLKPATYYDLVVQVAIVRPGPIHGDMVHPYLKRKSGKEAPDLPLPELEPILGRTFGVPIFQEQVIAMAMVAAGFNADEAEELRRSMASWKQEGHMGRLRQKMTLNLLERGVTPQYIERLCRQIEGFGEYGFPESHAASFALIVYVSAWLKHYYPAEFCCGLLNSQPMGFYQPWQLIQDVQRHGVTVLPVDINHSQWQHTVELHARTPDGKGALRLGFQSIKGMNSEVANRIVQNRPASGFRDIAEVSLLPGMHRDNLERLASANAFACFGGNRYQQRWQAAGHQFYQHLYESQPLCIAEPGLHRPTRFAEMMESYEATRIVLDDHPLALLREGGKLEDCVTAESLMELPHDQEVFVAGLVINRQRPKTSAGVTFVTLEDETGSANLVVWLQTALRQMETLVKSRVLKAYGRIDKDEEGKVVHVIVHRLFDLTALMQRLHSPSRDFH